MKKTIAVIFFIIVLAFIWAQSTLSQTLSAAESNFILTLFSPIVSLFDMPLDLASHVIRKMAHYFEFAILGLFSISVFKKEKRKLFIRIILSVLVCLAAAFIDESIQIFSLRGPGIVDVWIDFSGAFVGMLVGLLL